MLAGVVAIARELVDRIAQVAHIDRLRDSTSVGKKAPLEKNETGRGAAFTLAGATAERVKGNCFQYDECASGRRIYAYVDNNPIGNTDPLGLFELQSFPESVVNFSGGIGDVILLGQGQKLRDLAGVNGGINKCSGAYGAGDPSGGT